MYGDYTQGPCRWGWQSDVPMVPWVRRAEELAKNGPVVLSYQYGTLATSDGIAWISTTGQKFARLVEALVPEGMTLPSIKGERAEDATSIRAGLVIASRFYRARIAGREYDDDFRAFFSTVLNDYLGPRLIRTSSRWWREREAENWSAGICRAALRRHQLA